MLIGFRNVGGTWDHVMGLQNWAEERRRDVFRCLHMNRSPTPSLILLVGSLTPDRLLSSVFLLCHRVKVDLQFFNSCAYAQSDHGKKLRLQALWCLPQQFVISKRVSRHGHLKHTDATRTCSSDWYLPSEFASLSFGLFFKHEGTFFMWNWTGLHAPLDIFCLNLSIWKKCRTMTSQLSWEASTTCLGRHI